MLKRTIILGLLTSLALECTSLFFKLDRDLGQIIVYPLILFAYIYCLARYLPKIVVYALLSTLILLIFSFLWAKGDFGTGGVSYVSKMLVGASNPKMEQVRADFNRDSEVLKFPKLETIYRNFSNESADEWGSDNYRLLIYSAPSDPKLKLFLKELSLPLPVESNGVELSIQLFPEWISIDPRGISVDYLTTLTRVLPLLKRQKDELQKLEDLGFAGYSAGLSSGRWNSPVPRAAALLLGASANLAKNSMLGDTELKCIRRDLLAVLKKTRITDSPELRALALNNLGVTLFKLYFATQPIKAVGLARRLFAQATAIRSFNGEVVNGARLATKNLFALDALGLSASSKARRVKARVKSKSKKLEE